jgi:hypothetical protein
LLESTVSVPTTLGSLIGRDYNQINVRSKVMLPVFSHHHKGEIVCVLDFSWSMTETVNGAQKYQTLRNEAVELINALTQNGENTDVKIGLGSVLQQCSRQHAKVLLQRSDQLIQLDTLCRGSALSL